MKYAGIGARKTPEEILMLMRRLATIFGKKGYKLRSGGALGADKAFEMGAKGQPCDVFTVRDVPDDPNFWAYDMAKSCLLPQLKWDTFKPYVQKLFARNMMIILGPKGDDPVDRVFCWTPTLDYENAFGGTPHSLRCAARSGIPIHNLYDQDVLEKVEGFFGT